MTKSFTGVCLISSVWVSIIEVIRDLPCGGVRNEQMEARARIIIQSVTPACGGILFGKWSGVGSTSVSESEGISSSDICRVIITRHLNQRIDQNFCRINQ